MHDLKQQAGDLGIAVNPRWSEETLRRKIAEALASAGPASPTPAVPAAPEEADPAPSPAPPVPPLTHEAAKTTYRLLRDYWDERGERIAAGADVSLADDEARRLGPAVLKPRSVFA